MHLESLLSFAADAPRLTLAIIVPLLFAIARVCLHVSALCLDTAWKYGMKTQAFARSLVFGFVALLFAAGLYIWPVLLAFRASEGKFAGLIYSIVLVGATELAASILIEHMAKRKKGAQNYANRPFPPLPD